MKLSDEGRDLLKQREGERLTSYLDSAGIWTIGVGHTAPWIQKGSTINQKESDSFFNSDVAWAEEAVTNSVRVGITQNQFDALVSFTFNVGETAFKRSTLLRELNKGNYWAVPAQMLRWNKVTVNGRKKLERGLTNRRTSEVTQWNSVASQVMAFSARPDEPEGRKPLALMSGSKTAQAGAAVAATGGYSFFADLAEKAQELKVTLMDVLPDANMAFLALCVIGIFIAYNRWADSKKGRAY